MAYYWTNGFRYHVDAEVAGAEVKRIEQKYGVCKPQCVVDESQPEDAPLHSEFEWDDAVAANEHRLEQARCLIRSIRIADEPTGERKHAFFHVATQPVKGYVDRARVMSEPELHRAALEEAVRYLNGAKARFDDLSELEPVWATVEEVAEKVL